METEQVISTKAEMEGLLQPCLTALETAGLEAMFDVLSTGLLRRKVRFPLLEQAGRQLWQAVAPSARLAYVRRVAALGTEGGNVLVGIGLQQLLAAELGLAFAEAAAVIAAGKEWYVADIVGERVFGVGLLAQPAQALPLLAAYLQEGEAGLTRRGVGAGLHFALKKGLPASWAAQVLQLLLSHAHTRNSDARQGIGWAAKTLAKFHPALIHQFAAEIAQTAAWFRTKVNIGLDRNRHAQGN